MRKHIILLKKASTIYFLGFLTIFLFAFQFLSETLANDNPYSIKDTSISSGSVYDINILNIGGVVYSGDTVLSGAKIVLKANNGPQKIIYSKEDGKFSESGYTFEDGQNIFYFKLLDGNTTLFEKNIAFIVDTKSPEIKNKHSNYEGKTINYKLETNEDANCKFGDSEIIFNDNTSAFRKVWETSKTYEKYGEYKIFYGCRDKVGNFTNGEITGGIYDSKIVLQKPKKNGLYSGNIKFLRTYGDQNAISGFKLKVSKKSDFSSIFTEISTSNTGTEHSITETGKYYYKIEGVLKNNKKIESETNHFYVNFVEEDNLPTDFEIRKLWTGDLYEGDFVPLKIIAYQKDKKLENFEDKIVFKEKDGKNNKFSFPGYYKFSKSDDGVKKFIYDIKALEEGEYTIVIHHKDFSVLKGEVDIKVHKRKEMGFQHFGNVELDKEYTSSEYTMPSKTKENTKIEISKGDLLVNGRDRGDSYPVDEGDTIKIELDSPRFKDKCNISILKVNGEKKASFGLCTKTDNEDEDHFSSSVPSFSTAQKMILIQKLDFLFKKYLLKGNDIENMKTKLLELISNKVFEEDQRSKWSNDMRIKNKSKFKYEVYVFLEKIITNYNVNITKSYENTGFKLSYPFAWNHIDISDGVKLYNGKNDLVKVIYYKDGYLQGKVDFFQQNYKKQIGQMFNGWILSSAIKVPVSLENSKGQVLTLIYKKDGKYKKNYIFFLQRTGSSNLIQLEYNSEDYNNHKNKIENLKNNLYIK